MLAKKENTVRHGLVLRKMKAPSHTHVQKTWKSLCWGAESFSSCLHVSIGPFLSNLNLMWNIWRKLDVGLRGHVCEHVHIFCD